MVYGRPETVSDVYANRCERGCKKREGRREKVARKRRGGRAGGRERGREEFAKMPSHGSLQQAVKVRPGRGEKAKTSLGLSIYLSFKPDYIFCLISVA